jgi:hypothetical protein
VRKKQLVRPSKREKGNELSDQQKKETRKKKAKRTSPLNNPLTQVNKLPHDLHGRVRPVVKVHLDVLDPSVGEMRGVVQFFVEPV